MADKEERIFVFATKKYTIKETKEDGVMVDGSIEPNKAKVYTRQEAIEIMAKAIRNWEFPYSPRQIGWEDLSEDTKDDYREMAEAALNALLGVEK